MMTLMPVMAFAAGTSNVTGISVRDSVNGFATMTATRDSSFTDADVVVATLEGVAATDLYIQETATTGSQTRAVASANVNFTFEKGSLQSKPVYIKNKTNNALNDLEKVKIGDKEFNGVAQQLQDAVELANSKTNVSEVNSVVAINGGDANVESNRNATASNITTDDAKTVQFDIVLRNAQNDTISASQNIWLWVEEEGRSGQASDALVLLNNHDGVTVTPDDGLKNVFKVTTVANKDVTSVYAQFLRSGNFVLKASLDNPAGKKLSDLRKLSIPSGKEKITVTAPSADTRTWGLAVSFKDKTQPKLANGEWKKVIVTDEAKGNDTWKEIVEFAKTDTVSKVNVVADGGKVGYINVNANTVAVTPVTLQLFSDGTKGPNAKPVSSYPIKLSTNSANIELSAETVYSDYNGEATFNIAGLREGEYKVYVAVGDYEATLVVKVGATAANEITTIKFPSNPIATDTAVDDYANIFRFQLTDANGNIVAERGTTKGAENATATTPNTDQAKYVAVVKAPEANKVKDADVYIKLVTDGNNQSKDYYTFAFRSGKKFEAEGDYEVRVVLDNGKSVTVPFTVKKFDKAVSLHIEYPTEAVELNASTDVPDIYFLDANNVMKKANNRVTVAATGYAVASVVENGKNAGIIKVKNDEKYLGQTITVSAVAEKENLVATTTLTVTDSAQSVKLDTNRGQVNAANRIGFKLVNSNGQAVALGNDTNIDEVTCIVTNVENPDAKVSFSVAGTTKSDLKNYGTGVVTLTSNKETTATVQIMIKVTKANNANQAGDNNTGLSTTYYTGTETFTFGAEADKSVVMTIGSKEIVANNVPATIDVAPFIRDNRTFVPFRALVEAFGAEVAYDEATSTVTTKLDGKTVVLTVGSTVLTVNDETVTMDVAPYIVNDRVVVPVRFVGEAFGFTVEATQDAETGATASVVFYQK